MSLIEGKMKIENKFQTNDEEDVIENDSNRKIFYFAKELKKNYKTKIDIIHKMLNGYIKYLKDQSSK